MGFLPIIGGLFAGGAGAAGVAGGTAGLFTAGGITGLGLGGVTAATIGTGAAAATGLAGMATVGMGAGALGLAAGITEGLIAAAPAVAPAALAGAAAAGSFWANAANMASVVGSGVSLAQGMFGQQQEQQELPQELQMPELKELPEEADPRKAALQAAEQERTALKRRVSFTKTILTGPRGLLDAAPVGYKTLMGS